MLWNAVQRLFEKSKDLPRLSVAFLGFGLIYRWRYWLRDTVTMDFGAWQLDSHTVYSVMKIVLFIALALALLHMGPMHRRRGLCGAAAVCLSVGTLSCYYSMVAGYPAPLYLGGMLLEVSGIVLFTAMWFELYGCLAPIATAFALASSILLNCLFDAFLRGISLPAQALVLAAAPFVSFAAIVYGFGAIEPQRLPDKSLAGGSVRPIVALLTWTVFTNFAYRFTLGDVSSSSPQALLGRFCFSGFVLAAMFLLHRRLTTRRLFKVIVPGVFLLFAVGFAFKHVQPLSALSIVLATMAGGLNTILCFTFACGVGYRSRSSAAPLACLTSASNTIGLMLAENAVSFFSWVEEVPMTLAGVAVLALMAMVCRVAFDKKTLDALSIYVGNLDGIDNAADYVLSNLPRISSLHGLSIREREVFSLVMMGASTADIANELFIAPSTVRVHVRNVYQKFGVHDRASLMEALADEMRTLP